MKLFSRFNNKDNLHQSIKNIVPYVSHKIALWGNTDDALKDIIMEQHSVPPSKLIPGLSLALYMHHYGESNAVNDVEVATQERQFAECVWYVKKLYNQALIPEFSNIINSLASPNLAECSSCLHWDRTQPLNIRIFAEQNILDWCTQKNKHVITLVSIASGLLLQEAHIAYLLVKAGINVNFILIDPLYLHLNKKIEPRYKYEENRSPHEALIEFKRFINKLHGKANLIGVFSNIDSYLAAYAQSPAPRYKLDDIQANHWNDDALHQHKSHCNQVWAGENAQYSTLCAGITPDLIIAIHPTFINGSSFSGLIFPPEKIDNCNEDNDLYPIKRTTWIFINEYMLRMNAIFKNSRPQTKIFMCSPRTVHKHNLQIKDICQDLLPPAQIFICAHEHATVLNVGPNRTDISEVALGKKDNLQIISPPSSPKQHRKKFEF